VRDQLLEATLERRWVVFVCAVVVHGLKGAGRTPAPGRFSPSRLSGYRGGPRW
jgi:hypothetical protein